MWDSETLFVKQWDNFLGQWDQGWIQRRIFGGLRGPAGQNFGAAAAITTFLSEFRGKTGLNLLKRPAAGDFF